MKNNEKGIALITTLILGVVALAFIGGLLYMLTSGTHISGSSKRYYTALEAAKGGANLVMIDAIEDKKGNSFKCGGGTCTPCPTTENSSCKLDLTKTTLGNYTISVYLKDKRDIPNGATIYTFKVEATNTNSKEKAIIEFVYKVE